MSTELEVEFPLGDDSDCETCGTSWNRLTYRYEPVTGTHRVETMVGCYGGDSLETQSGEVARAYVAGFAKSYPDAAPDLVDLGEAIAALAVA